MKYYISLIAVFLIVSCKKTDHSVLITSHEFPVAIGSWWQYQVLDKDNSVFDTVTYTILGVSNYGGQSFQRWGLMNYSGYYDTIDVPFTDSTEAFPDYTIRFPVVDNQPWVLSPGTGVNYTTQFQNVTVNSGSYTAVFLHEYVPTTIYWWL